MSTDRARPSAALVMFPGLDDYYKAMPARVELTRIKREAEATRGGRRR